MSELLRSDEARARQLAELRAGRLQYSDFAVRKGPALGRGGRPREEPKRFNGHYAYEFIIELDDLRFFAEATAEALPLLREYREWIADFGDSGGNTGDVLPALQVLWRMSTRLEAIAAVQPGFDWWGTGPECLANTSVISGETLKGNPLETRFHNVFNKLAMWLMGFEIESDRGLSRLTRINDENFKAFEAIARRLKELHEGRSAPAEPPRTEPADEQAATATSHPAGSPPIRPIKCTKRALCRALNRDVYRSDIVEYLIRKKRIGVRSEDLGRNGAKVHPLTSEDREAIQRAGDRKRAMKDDDN